MCSSTGGMAKADVAAVTCSSGITWCTTALVDGNHQASTWQTSPHGSPNSCSSPLWVQLDLGTVKKVKEVRIWHYYADARKYCGQKLQISVNTQTWTTVYDTGTNYGDAETSAGKTISFSAQSARYVRHYAGKSNANGGTHFLEIEVYEQTGHMLPLFSPLLSSPLLFCSVLFCSVLFCSPGCCFQIIGV